MRSPLGFDILELNHRAPFPSAGQTRSKKGKVRVLGLPAWGGQDGPDNNAQYAQEGFPGRRLRFHPLSGKIPCLRATEPVLQLPEPEL